MNFINLTIKSNNLYSLINETKIPLKEIKDKNALFIVHPALIYPTAKIETNQDIYFYLYNDPQKKLVYASKDGKTIIYRINSDKNFKMT